MEFSKYIFATNNRNKLSEVREIAAGNYTILSLEEIGYNAGEIPEDYNTLEENAMQKAQFIFEKYGLNCFADDTGLEVDILDGEPGVFSARYAGEGKKSIENVEKLLKKLRGQSNRKAKFKTVIALIIDGNKYLFEGVIKGDISEDIRGTGGFGYDPVFIPEFHLKTFAELPIEEKNKISHRAIALKKLFSFLTSYKK